MCKPRGDRTILRTGKLNRSQPSADPEGRGQAVRTPWKIASYLGFHREKAIAPPPTLEKFGPPPEP